jgi:hypothetical protein
MEGSKYGPLGAACPHLNSRSDLATAQISANARANAKIRAFMMAARDLIELSAQMEAQAAGACRRIGHDIGLAPADMAARSDEPGEDARAACNAVGARIDAIFQQGIQVRVQATPPSCQADVQAKARCDAACDVQVDPGQVVAQCEPARLSGYSGTMHGAMQRNLQRWLQRDVPRTLRRSMASAAMRRLRSSSERRCGM